MVQDFREIFFEGINFFKKVNFLIKNIRSRSLLYLNGEIFNKGLVKCLKTRF